MSDQTTPTPDGNGGGAVGTLTKKNFTSDQEVRWCPGCGDYAILATVQSFMPELGILPDDTVFVSGIGCSGRFTYYMDTYGMHGIHGRAPALATGIATARPELSVWVVTGDGDGLSIGGNHLIHALRRNVNLKILLFNNQIYGLTKGQYSPTSEEGKVTKSTPFGSVDHPFNPIALALGAEATFVARTMDNDKQHLTAVLRKAAEHRGAAFVEIYQNCNVFNDGAFDLLREKPQGAHNQIRLEHGQPIVFDEGTRCVAVGENGRLVIAKVDEVDEGSIVVHDVHGRPSLAFALAHLSRGPSEPTAIGVFREVERPVFGEATMAQVDAATERLGKGSLDKLLHSGDTWNVS
jgi:2-oxoglutarate/2-oxoacid ferredoxin oxidoreductase subunit beta